MSANSTTSRSNHTRTTSGRVKQRIEQLENVTIQPTKPIPISQRNNNYFTSGKQLSTITSKPSTSSLKTALHASTRFSQSTPSKPITPRKRTKSKMEIFEDVYEQLEQLDEIYFENMSIDDSISSSPVIQFDTTLEQSIPNLRHHIRMNSVMSRDEYETKRELICQQYYNAESDDDFTMEIPDNKTSDTNYVENVEEKSNYLDPDYYKFSYLELKNQFPKGVRENEKEKYLTDTEFFTVFGLDRKQFESLGEYKRRRLKIDKGLF